MNDPKDPKEPTPTPPVPPNNVPTPPLELPHIEPGDLTELNEGVMDDDFNVDLDL